MIMHVWSVLCRMASFDAQNNSVSMFSAIEAVTALGEPSTSRPVLLEGELVSLWYREDVDKPISGKMRSYYIDPDGKESSIIGLDINLMQSLFHRTRINMPAVPIFLKGKYTFKVEYQVEGSDKWQLAATLPLVVMVEQLPQTQSTENSPIMQ